MYESSIRHLLGCRCTLCASESAVGTHAFLQSADMVMVKDTWFLQATTAVRARKAQQRNKTFPTIHLIVMAPIGPNIPSVSGVDLYVYFICCYPSY